MVEPERQRIRIVSDGYGMDTKVYLKNEDGTETLLTGVTRATWTCSGHGAAVVTLEVEDAEVDVEGDQHALDCGCAACEHDW